MTTTKSQAEYHALAERRGFLWLGPPVPNSHTKTGWQCAAGHRWQTAYRAIRQGTGCPVCAGNAPKTEVDYVALATQMEFVWLGPKVKNTMIKTAWRCRFGHVWYASYNTIDKGSNCAVCVRRARRLDLTYHALAAQHDLEWLGPDVDEPLHLTNWACPNGHHWAASFDAVRAGQPCPVCRRDKKKKIG